MFLRRKPDQVHHGSKIQHLKVLCFENPRLPELTAHPNSVCTSCEFARSSAETSVERNMMTLFHGKSVMEYSLSLARISAMAWPLLSPPSSHVQSNIFSSGRCRTTYRRGHVTSSRVSIPALVDDKFHAMGFYDPLGTPLGR